MPAAELPADFLERRRSELPDEVHGDLARKYVGTATVARRELRVAHLSQVEVLAHLAADRLDCCGHRRGIKGATFVRFTFRTLRRGEVGDGAQPNERREPVLFALLF